MSILNVGIGGDLKQAIAGGVIAMLCALPVSAADIQVRAGDSLQAALNGAKPGDVVIVQASSTFVGPFVLPAKAAGPVITIRSSATLPERRITPADAGLLPTLTAGAGVNASVITCTAGCVGWRLDGLRIQTSSIEDIIVVQDGVNITFDRILMQSPGNDTKRGIKGNGRDITLTRSHIDGIWRTGQDTQAFCAYDGAGPYRIEDNYLEAASENILFGGANSQSPANIPSDILVKNNDLAKRLAWKGQPRTVKNNFELKSARRVVVDGNRLTNNWTDAQNGYAALITTRNDEGQSPWSVVEDVLFIRNVFTGVENGINILGIDSYQQSGQTANVRIWENDVTVEWNGFQIGGEVMGISLARNKFTITQDGKLGGIYGGNVWPTVEKLTAPRLSSKAAFNVALFENTGNKGIETIHGADVGPGEAAFKALFGVYTLTSDVIPGSPSTPPAPVPAPTPTPDEVAMLRAELAAAKADGAITKARLDALLAYLGKTPTATRIAQVVAYLRGVGK